MQTILNSFRFNWYAVPVLASGILMFFTGLFIHLQNRRSSANTSFFLICICGLFWLGGTSAVYVSSSSDLALAIYRRVSFLGVAFISSSIYLFSVFWLGRYEQQRWLVRIFFTSGLVFYLAGLVSSASFMGTYHYFWGYYPQYGPLNRLFLVFFYAALAVAFYNFITAYRDELPGIRKTQILLVIAAFIVAFIGSSDFLPKLSYIPVYPFGFLCVFFWILIVAYAIVRRRLFDIEILAHLIQETRLSAMGLLTSSINHEIKNPLFIIKGTAETYLEDLAERYSDDQQLLLEKHKAAFRKIFAQSERALEIMKNFAEFGKRESGRTFDAQDHEVATLLKNVLQLAGGELALDHIGLRVDIPEGLSVYIDHYAAEEIFLNLIINACHAMSQGGELTISARAEGSLVKILVSDTGPGISASQLRNIFKPFNTSKSSGTGLGLYVVKQLTRRSKGTIQVVSEEGRGCTFTLRFPGRKRDSTSVE
jgi:signal transduction histidine kinase